MSSVVSSLERKKVVKKVACEGRKRLKVNFKYKNNKTGKK